MSFGLARSNGMQRNFSSCRGIFSSVRNSMPAKIFGNAKGEIGVYFLLHKKLNILVPGAAITGYIAIPCVAGDQTAIPTFRNHTTTGL